MGSTTFSNYYLALINRPRFLLPVVIPGPLDPAGCRGRQCAAAASPRRRRPSLSPWPAPILSQSLWLAWSPFAILLLAVPAHHCRPSIAATEACFS